MPHTLSSSLDGCPLCHSLPPLYLSRSAYKGASVNRFYSFPMTRLPYPHTLALQPTTPLDTPGTVYIQIRSSGAHTLPLPS